MSGGFPRDYRELRFKNTIIPQLERGREREREGEREREREMRYDPPAGAVESTCPFCCTPLSL